MAYVNETEYANAIESLKQFITDAKAKCEDITAAAQDCVDNTDKDPKAVAVKKKLDDSVKSIETEIESIEKVCTKMQEQLDEVRNTTVDGLDE